jgi:hypothetical protein
MAKRRRKGSKKIGTCSKQCKCKVKRGKNCTKPARKSCMKTCMGGRRKRK